MIQEKGTDQYPGELTFQLVQFSGGRSDLSATADGGQVTVLGKGTKTRSIRLPQSVWKLLMALPRGREASDPVLCPARSERSARARCGGLCGLPLGAPASRRTFRPIGCVTPTGPMRSTVAHRSILSKRRSVMLRSRLPAAISTRGPRTAQAVSWPYEKNPSSRRQPPVSVE